MRGITRRHPPQGSRGNAPSAKPRVWVGTTEHGRPPQACVFGCSAIVSGGIQQSGAALPADCLWISNIHAVCFQPFWRRKQRGVALLRTSSGPRRVVYVSFRCGRCPQIGALHTKAFTHRRGSVLVCTWPGRLVVPAGRCKPGNNGQNGLQRMLGERRQL